MMNKKRLIGKWALLMFILGLTIIGSGWYYYGMKDVEPTHGVFVFNSEMKKKGCLGGDLHQSS